MLTVLPPRPLSFFFFKHYGLGGKKHLCLPPPYCTAGSPMTCRAMAKASACCFCEKVPTLFYANVQIFPLTSTESHESLLPDAVPAPGSPTLCRGLKGPAACLLPCTTTFLPPFGTTFHLASQKNNPIAFFLTHSYRCRYVSAPVNRISLEYFSTRAYRVRSLCFLS